MGLEVKGINFSYNDRPVLQGISFCVGKEEILAILGPNGSGKTTLLKCIIGILKPSTGSVFLEGKKVSNFKGKEQAKKIAYVPQIPPNQFSATTVFDFVLLGRKPYLNWRPSLKDLQIVSQVLDTVGSNEFALRSFDALSGGEKQKVLIARAIVQRADIMLLDEPTAHLDLKHQIEILEMVKNLTQKERISILMCMHDLNLALRYSDKLIMLKNGKMFGMGTPKEIITSENIKSVYGVEASIYNHSQTPYVVAKKSLKEF